MKSISETARWVAWARAEESLRPAGLFVDELAVEVHRRFPADQPLPSKARARFVIRTRFFDDYLTALARAGVAQVVLLAAGLDARAFRLDWPAGTRLFEVDLPGLFEEKEKIVGAVGARPRCARVVVPADLTDAAWTSELAAAGFDPGVPTAWLAEGLFFYLTEHQADQVLSGIGRSSAAGSALGLDHVGTPVLADAQSRRWLASMDERDRGWHSAVDRPEHWLAGYGWQADVRRSTDADLAHGCALAEVRPPGEPTRRHWLITARLREPASPPDRTAAAADAGPAAAAGPAGNGRESTSCG
ncbi:SAM-dependent methyltransferase [Nonomuraea sp. NN258]|uniref:SAM-dependent methyltransferase n=1 Tax=Nonomuraea antri TaxID=2730852 RepID=UPI001568AAE8|nr:SAM-dependent methyltransferase [Nonomuraea antri]NRQ35405.1 SAM-dependent methyltransferase [Nonomuraea antri]